MVFVLALLALLPMEASASLSRIRARSDGTFVDEEGRTRIFHGFNDVQEGKGAGYKPGGIDYLPKLLMQEHLVQPLEDMGFNAMRLPMMWAGAMPHSDMKPDEAYLGTMLNVTKSLEQHHMYSLLDMHQDGLTSRWAWYPGGVFCVHPGCGYDGAPLWLVNRTVPKHAYPWPFPKIPFVPPIGVPYIDEATAQAFQEIYDNTHGGLDAWAAFWDMVARRFKAQSSVLGYELINEPWPGDQYEDPLIMLPGRAAQRSFAPAYKKIASSIREVDNETLIFFEPTTWALIMSKTSGFETAPDPQSVLSYHYYCTISGNQTHPSHAWSRRFCDKNLGPEVFNAVASDRKKLRVPSMMTEWGNLWPTASSPRAASTVEIEAVMDLADQDLQSWTFWDILAFSNVKSKTPWNTTATWNMDEISVFARPYAQAIAGTNASMKFDSTTLRFTLEFLVDTSIKAPTEIVVPAIRYPNGFDVELSPGLSMKMLPSRKNVMAVFVSTTESPKTGKVSITQKPAVTSVVV